MRLVLGLLLIPILGMGQYKYERDSVLDVISYHIALKLYDTTDVIVGENRIEFMLSQPKKQIVIDLVQQSKDRKGMKVSKITHLGRALSFEQKEHKIFIQLPANIRINAIESIIVSYSGIPKDGLIISKNKHGDRTFFGDNWPNRAHHWFPCIDHPAEKAMVNFEVEAPSDYQVVANGVLAEQSDLLNHRRVTKYRCNQVLPTKVMVIGVARFAKSKCTHNGNIEQMAWVYPQEKVDGFSDYCSATKILEWFETKIDDYPYEQLSHVQSKTRYGGMENASCIFYHENSIDGKQGSEYLFAHEIAHQWFGNSASELKWQYVWLSEGFATYLTEVYKQETSGEKAFQEGMKAAKDKVVRFQSKFPKAIVVDSTLTNLNHYLSPVTYQKAAWVLHMIRGYIGDDLFWVGVKKYYDQYKFSNASSDDLQQVFESVSGEDLTMFFDQWLYQPYGVNLEYTWKYNAKQQKVVVHLEQPKSRWFCCPIQFSFLTDDGAVISSVKKMRKRDMTLEFDLKLKPHEVVFDPLNKVLKY